MSSKIILFLCSLGCILSFNSCKEANSTVVVETTNSNTNSANFIELEEDKFVGNHAVAMPDEISFAGETVPVNNTDIRERVDRELHVNAFWQSQTFLFIKRANRWFPIIEKILKEEGIPDDFKYLAVIESGLMDVVSPSGAAGFWQFMPSTARGYDLEISNSVDERYNVELATRAACDYLKVAYKKFNSWTSAAASYNMGKGGLNKRLTNQQVTSYYDLHLNNETSRYVPRIIAVKYILSDPAKFGFHCEASDLYDPYITKQVTVDTSVTNLVSFAKQQGVSYRTLKVVNSWLRSDELTISQEKVYNIKIPTEGFPIDNKNE